MKKQIDFEFINNNLQRFIPITLIAFGLRKVVKILMEEKMKRFKQKDIFDYLIQNRIFIENLSDNDIKDYYKIFKKIYKYRKKENIKRIICIGLFGYRNI